MFSSSIVKLAGGNNSLVCDSKHKGSYNAYVHTVACISNWLTSSQDIKFSRHYTHIIYIHITIGTEVTEVTEVNSFLKILKENY